jgi:WD40 repeat protein
MAGPFPTRSPRLVLAAAGILVTLAMPGFVRSQPAEVGQVLLRLEAGGPTADVTSLVFSPDGKTLYSAGFDKVVRVWKFDPDKKEFQAQRTSYRVPIGPGISGAINALAISEDGKWLAVGGQSIFEGQATFKHTGLVVPADAKTDSMLEDESLIYVFETAQPDKVLALRGHRGPILALSFVQGSAAAQPLLASAGIETEGLAKRGSLRLWDVVQRKSIAANKGLPDSPALHVGLAARKAGEAAQVAAAWNDGAEKAPGRLFLWDTAADKLHMTADGGFNNTVAFLPGGELVSGSFSQTPPYSGVLKSWTIAADGLLAPGAAVADFPHDKLAGFSIPRALAAAPGQRLATVLRIADGKGAMTYRLSLRSPDGSAKSVKLWDGAGRTPAIAAAGGNVAVAGKSDHSILVYAVKDLLAENNEPQVLRSIGEQFDRVTFVKNAKGNLGLRLQTAKERAENGAGMVFDFIDGKLVPFAAEWKVDAPDNNGWNAAGRPNNQPGYVVTPPGGNPVTIVPTGSPTRALFLAPSKNLDVPLLAISTSDGTDHRLSFYDASKGKMVCELTGHTGAIRSFAFSGDGRLFASVADDQTVCVWNLFKLDLFLGKQGQLHGVVVQPGDGGKLTVKKVTAEGVGLKPGDVLEGVVRNGKVRPFADVIDYYDTLLAETPGGKATLRLAGGQDALVPMGQAVQQRTPLLQLFVTIGGKIEDRGWLAWNPIGPYDSSDPKMVTSFGWHFNPAKLGEKSQFTVGAENDLKERRPGLLQDLVKHTSLAPAIKSWQERNTPKAPKMTMGILGRDIDPKILVREEAPTAWLEIDDRDSKGYRILSVHWTVDGVRVGESKAKGFDYKFVLPALKRGEHTVTATVKLGPTYGIPAENADKSIILNFVPERPTLELGGANFKPGMELKTAEPKFLLSATAKAGAKGEDAIAQVEYLQMVDGKLMPLLSVKKANKIEQTIDLVPGPNTIRITSWNQGAEGQKDDQLRAMEIVSEIVLVHYNPPAPPPMPVVLRPQVVLDSVIPYSQSGAVRGERIPVDQNLSYIVVSTPRIKIIGSIDGRDRTLLKAHRETAEGTLTPLDEFTPKKTMRYKIEEGVVLDKGKQIVKIIASVTTKTGEEMKEIKELKIDYRVPANQTEIKAKVGPVFIDGNVVVDEGEGPPLAILQGTLLENRDAKTRFAKIRLNEGPPSAAALVAGSWEGKVQLVRGMNRIRVELSNEWGGETQAVRDLKLVQPPSEPRAQLPKETNQQEFEATAEVDSSLPITAEYVRTTVSEREATVLQVEKDPKNPGGRTYKIRVRLPLQEGLNEVKMMVANADGPGKPLERPMTYKPLNQPPPKVALVNPSTGGSSEAAIMTVKEQLPVKFRIEAFAPIQELWLHQDGRDVKKLNPAAVVDKGNGVIELNHTLELAHGATRVWIAAKDRWGVGKSTVLVVNYVPVPVEMQLVSLAAQDAGPALPLQRQENGSWTCAPMAFARAEIAGKVVWNTDDPRMKDSLRAIVYVNGSKQWEDVIEPPTAGSKVRHFKAEVVFNREKGNTIEVEFPDLNKPEKGWPKAVVDCRKPFADQRLHVQIISPDHPDDAELNRQVLGILKATDVNERNGRFNRPGFPNSRLYDTLVEDVTRQKVLGRMKIIRDAIQARKEKQAPNDVVLIYFVGGETVDREGKAKMLTYGKPPPVALISREQIQKEFSEMFGVKVLLLDLTQQEAKAPSDLLAQRVSNWLESPTRHVWMRAMKADPTPNVSLLSALEQEMPGSDNLGEMLRRVERRLGLQFLRDWFLPDDLDQLALK